MHMAPADATGGDMGAMMQDGIDMMMPEGVDCPPAIMDAMGDMGSAMGDAGMGCHDVATEFMAPPGDPMYPLPMDGQGDPVVIPGDPSSCPADACQPPPMDGACATAAPDMMPPEGGYDHAPMAPEFVMSAPPYDAMTADGGPLSDMATPDPTGELSGAENIAPVDTAMVDTSGNQNDGGAGALGGALGVAPALGEEGFVGADPAADAADAALGGALDGVMDQGGGAIPVLGDADFVEAAPVAVDDGPVDDGSSAGG
jgi:hypothetical protein